MTPSKSLRWSRRLRFVFRWSVLPTMTRQNVAEHAFGVARAVMWLVDTRLVCLSSDEQAYAIREALTHDDLEAAFGDSPSPTKEPHRTLNRTSSVVKLADLLEARVFILEEQMLGNKMGTWEVSEYLEKEFSICCRLAVENNVLVGPVDPQAIWDAFVIAIYGHTYFHPVTEAHKDAKNERP